jgi:hypothetical protein
MLNPKAQKDLTVFFALLGSARIKAACKMLMKLTPQVIIESADVKIRYCSTFDFESVSFPILVKTNGGTFDIMS